VNYSSVVAELKRRNKQKQEEEGQNEVSVIVNKIEPLTFKRNLELIGSRQHTKSKEENGFLKCLCSGKFLFFRSNNKI
jgi:hypothetical protein